MDESIQNAEKLIEAANAVLARMKYDASYDDLSCIMGASKMSQKPVPEEEDGNFGGFKPGDYGRGSVAAAIDDAFPFDRRSSSARSSDAKMEEINRKIEGYKAELQERESVRDLRFDRRVLAATVSDSNLSQRTVTKTKPSVTEDLKLKLTQTQEIVDRGIQTARQLSERVDVLKMRPLKTDRYDEVSVLEKSESRSTVKTEVKRCRRCNGEMTAKRGGRQKNVAVVRVRGRDHASPCRGKQMRLHLQELPSLSIRGGLRCQRIPSVDIPPQEEVRVPVRANTKFETYDHDQILRDRIDRIVDELRRTNGFGETDRSRTGKRVECCHCGRVTTVRCDGGVDARRVDELLRMCDYNVFDPRIDQFVEGCGLQLDERATCTQTDDPPVMPEAEEPPPPPREVTTERTDAIPVPESKPRISDLSEEITRMYRQKAVELESDHLQFESILRDLFDKVDESRSLFKDCDYLKSIAEVGRRSRGLSVTTPVVLSYTGSGEEADDGKNAVLRPSKPPRQKMSGKDIRRKLERKELEVNCRVLSSSCPAKDKVQVGTEPGSVVERDALQLKVSRKVGVVQTRDIEVPNTRESTKLGSRNTLATPVEEVPRKETVPERKERKKPHRPTSLESKQPSSEGEQPTVPKPTPPPTPPPQPTPEEPEEPAKHSKGGSDYESDFEEDSAETSPAVMDADDTSYKYNARLSTISEVDSKISDLVITPEEEPKTDQPRPEEVTKDPPTSSSSEDDTRKLLRKVNRDLREVASQQLRSEQRSDSPREVTEPLKEVLSALKNQFERTELLADKLTESIKEVNDAKRQEDSGDRMSLSTDVMMVGVLQKVRNNVERKQVGGDVLQGLRFGRRPSKGSEDEEEDVASDGRLGGSARGTESPKTKVEEKRPEVVEEVPKSTGSDSSQSSGKPYSEGEISEQEILCSERSSPSIGEVISINQSDESLSEDISVINFFD